VTSERKEVEQMRRRVAGVLAACALLGAAACGGERETSSSEQRRADVASSDTGADAAREDLAKSEFARGYAIGWKSGCDRAFERIVGAVARDLQVDLTVEDCYALAPADLPAGSSIGADARAAGVRLGTADGCHAASAAVQRHGVVGWSQYPSLTESACR
jgi:hypothetical protein